MTDFEWLGEMMRWAVATLRGTPPPRDLDQLDFAARNGDGPPLAWDLLHHRLELSRTEQMTLLLALAAELSLEIAVLAGERNQDPRRQAIELGTLRALVYSTPEATPRFIVEQSPAGALYRFGLVEITDGPFLLQQVRPSRRLIEVVHGARGLDASVGSIAELIERPMIRRLELAHDIEARVLAFAAGSDGASTAESPLLVLRGADGSGRRSLLQSAAAKLGRACVLVDCARLPAELPALVTTCHVLVREARLAGAIVVLHDLDELIRDGATEHARIVDEHLLALLPGFVAATAGRVRRDVSPRCARGAVEIDVPLPNETERGALWQRELGSHATIEDAAWAAARYRLTGGDLVRAARSALAAAPTGSLLRADIHAGVRSSLQAKLGALAERIEITQSWGDLVLPAEILDEIAQMISRIENNALVYAEWGLGAKVGKGLGLSALFSGPPGTGKTMVAGVIAADLGLDLYRVDLSRIASKYIGETEKNLADLFDAAEAGHAILLFDEADAVFGKRTDVRTSTDRYANLEVNFLLQRMETFTGISILTTNHETAIDDAFKRRLSFRIAFPLPDVKERAQIWQTMLPPRATYEGDLGLAKLAEGFHMSGGYIKNAIVRAAFIAADRDEPITHRHLLKGAVMEYTAMGKIAPSA